MAEDYTCAQCGGEFLKCRSDESADEERATLFPGVPVESCEIVCEDCFKLIMKVMEPETDISEWVEDGKR